MDREQEEAVLRITADYVAELETGLHPHLSDYLARYPQYAEAIADFVAYYHAVEAALPASGVETGDKRILYWRAQHDAARLRKVAERLIDETDNSIS